MTQQETFSSSRLFQVRMLFVYRSLQTTMCEAERYEEMCGGKKIKSKIYLTEKMLPYQAEFFLQLREIEKVLPSSVQSEIKQDLQKLWNNEALEIVNITNALDRGGRVPLPLAGHYEG